jgi:hypothetical protein
MTPSKAIPEAVVSLGEGQHSVGAHQNNAPLVDVWKCPECGHSFQPPATPAGEKAGIHPAHQAFIDRFMDPQTTSQLREQLQQVTRERDEAKNFNRRLDIEYTRRAEAAEKKLAEVENWKELSVTAIAAENRSVHEYVQSLEQQLSRFRWIPTSKRLPTKEDGDEFGRIVAEDSDGGLGITRWDLWKNSYPKMKRWLAIPLPTPPEEDAFEKWISTVSPDSGWLPEYKVFLRNAFEAGLKSK